MRDTAKHIVDMIEEGTNVVVSHGNGPAGRHDQQRLRLRGRPTTTRPRTCPPRPAPCPRATSATSCPRPSERAERRGIMRLTACIVTETVVDEDDPAFQNPTKPVGAVHGRGEPRPRRRRSGITVKEDAGHWLAPGGRLPDPQAHRGVRRRADLGEDGYIVVSTGGGGVPVLRQDGCTAGTPAVIDKDRSSAPWPPSLGRRHAGDPHRRCRRLASTSTRRAADHRRDEHGPG